MKSFLSSRERMAADKMPSGSVKLSNEDGKGVSQVVSSDPNGAKVELISEKGVVQKIIVTCKCGERVELKCEY